MPSGAIVQPQPSLRRPLTPKSPALFLSIKSRMDNQGDMSFIGEHFDNSFSGRFKEDGNESRSGSDNIEGTSGDDQDAGADQRPRKKYHRHTTHQIQELESFFKECPHPDEKQRLGLSRRLGLESKQIKFWFQNRRTQMKTQLERHENIILRQENDKLRAENELLKQNVIDPVCNNCGGPVVPGPVSIEQQQLRIENVRLKDELGRVCALANKFLGRPLASSVSPIPSFGSSSKIDLAVGRNGFDSLSHLDATLPITLDYDDGVVMPLMRPMSGSLSNNLSYDRSIKIDLALAAMEELVKMVQTDSSLWMKTSDGRKEALNHEEYTRMFSPCIARKPVSFVTEATRETGVVLTSSVTLVEILLDANRWVETFRGVLGGASTIDIISSGTGGTRNGALQVMHAEFQILSPLVPVRQVKFLRFCKQHAEGLWAVVDVSVDASQDNSYAHALPTCRRLPSGCLIQDLPNGCCKVSWVEHSEYDESAVHQLYRQVLSSGRGFGAQRWVATLQRYFECETILMSSNITAEDQTALTLGGKKSMLNLAQRMVDSFFLGVCAAHKWDQHLVGNVGEDVRIMSRKNNNNPGEPDGIVLSVSTSVWLPVAQQRLFDFLRDEHTRSEWDILCHGGMMQEMIHVAKSQDRRNGNCVSLLRSNAVSNPAIETSMLVLQETWNDASGSLIVYAPVDVSSMAVVTNGGDSTYVSLLPSGFAILPDDSFSNGGSNDSCGGSDGCGCIATVGLQILVNSVPTGKLTMESVDTVHNLISCVIEKIKAALNLHSFKR